MKHELLQNPGIKNISLSSYSPTGIYHNGQDLDWEGKDSDINPLVTHFGADPSILAELKGASKKYQSSNQENIALQETHLALRKNELLLIIGLSGSGKTTLLSLLGCILYPTTGCVCIKEISTKDSNEKKLE